MNNQRETKMNTKTLAFIIVFAALTIAINVAGPKIPAPYAPFLYYQLWEIPIVISFLVLGRNSRHSCIRDKHTHLISVFSRRFPSGTMLQSNSSARNDDRRVHSIHSCNTKVAEQKT